MSLPPHEPQQVPEGHYRFQVIKEPEQRKHTSNATGKDFISITFSFKLEDPNGNIRYHKESILPWEGRYKDLLLAFGAEEDKDGKVHLSEQAQIIGKIFEAEIIHEPDRNDSSKSWSRIANIKTNDDVPPPAEEEDEVPF